MTPAQLRAAADEADAQAEHLEARAAIARGQAAQLRELADKTEAAAKGLRMDDTERSIRTMDVNTEGRSAAVKRGAGRATRKHPAQKRLYEKGKTITDIAAELNEGRPRVSAWFADGEANRPIPRRHAERLERKYGIPLSAWARIAD